MSVGELLGLFKVAACALTTAVVILRLPRVVRRRRVDFVWVGTALAALAFAINGHMMSERTVDAWLGGENMFHLVRNLVALASIWCLRAALVQSLQQEQWSRDRMWRECLFGGSLLTLLTAAFFSIDRGPTSGAFIPEHLSQGSTLIYTLLIMGVGGWNAADLGRVAFQEIAVRGHDSNHLIWVALAGLGGGCCLLVLGCALESSYAFLRYLSKQNDIAEILRSSFAPVFLPGAALVCATVAWLGLYTQGQRLRIDLRLDILRIVPVWLRLGAGNQSSSKQALSWHDAFAENPHEVLYTAVIAIEDTLRTENMTLTEKQRRALRAAERRFEITPCPPQSRDLVGKEPLRRHSSPR